VSAYRWRAHRGRHNARRGAVRKRSQLKVKVAGGDRWTKRNSTGNFLAQKKTANKFKGVRRERWALARDLVICA
jgi:hypothetical protein